MTPLEIAPLPYPGYGTGIGLRPRVPLYPLLPFSTLPFIRSITYLFMVHLVFVGWYITIPFH